MFALVTAPVEPLIKSTCGIETKFVPVIFIVVAVAGAIVCETLATVGLVSPTVTAPPNATAEPLIVILVHYFLQM